MIVRGTISHMHASAITTKRGTTTLTAVRIIDDHTRAQHGGQPGARHSPTRYEAQFVDSKLFEWSTALKARFSVGDEVLVYAEDTVRVQAADQAEPTVIIHGIDMGHSTQSSAHRQG